MDYRSSRRKAFYFNYTNAALITVAGTMLFGGLFVYFNPVMPVWSLIALIFVPVYSTLNLTCYLSQVTIIPRLVDFKKGGEYKVATDILIGQITHAWPGSIVSFLNGLAYAVLGIPSIIFGLAMLDEVASMPVAGVLITFSGISSIVGFVSLVIRYPRLSSGLAVGGALFAFALIPMAIAFLQM
ncbi:MAG: hypothetical protein JSU58_09880 [Dehalococcoidales bacterium]|nr:MAG: hypothetical protein JSU58_09880 [Dehalococcoidales bacterium]